MAAVAKALQIMRIREQGPVAFMIADMIHICRPNTLASLSTDPAERLTEKLLPSQELPFFCAVHPAPGFTLIAALYRLRLMIPTVSGICQGQTAGMPARPKGLIRHSDHLRAK